MVKIEIIPQPSDDERAAIAAALAQAAEEAPSAWAESVLPDRDDPVDP